MADIFEKIRNNIPFGDEWESFEKILLLPEEQFKVIYPEFKKQLEGVFLSESFQDELLTQVNSIQKESLKSEREDFENFLKELTEDDTLSNDKKELLIFFFENVVNSLYDMAENPRKKIQVKIEKINENAKIPEYAHPSDAGADIYAAEDIIIEPNETQIVRTGIQVAIPVGYTIFIYPRSGMSLKTGLRIANSVGVIDSNYRGEIGVIMTNLGQTPETIKIGDKIAQMVIAPAPMIKWVEEKIDMDTDRGTGGFGSTGN